MTTPSERTRAVVEMGAAVSDLATHLVGKGETVRIPRAKIVALWGWMRHYPMDSELDATARQVPELWAPVQK